MPRTARIVIPKYPYHVTQRGNYRQEIFQDKEDQIVNLIGQTISNDVELAFSSKKFIQIQNELQGLHIPEKIRGYFKR